MKKNTKRLDMGVSMRNLRQACESIMGPIPAKNMAFHLAELKPEFSKMVDILTHVEKTGAITPRELKIIASFIAFHWPYHLKAIRRLVLSRTVAQVYEKYEGALS